MDAENSQQALCEHPAIARLTDGEQNDSPVVATR